MDSSDKDIRNIGIRAAIMTGIVFIGIYLGTKEAPYPINILPIICVIPPIIYVTLALWYKKTKTQFFTILKKQNGKCKDCRKPISEMSSQTWILNNNVYCLDCGEEHDR